MGSSAGASGRRAGLGQVRRLGGRWPGALVVVGMLTAFLVTANLAEAVSMPPPVTKSVVLVRAR